MAQRIYDLVCEGINQAVDKLAHLSQSCPFSADLAGGEVVHCSDAIWTIRVAGLIATLVVLFGLVGVAAFDYMVPNLRALASRSGLSQSVIGVSFMAFGNGSVDVFGATMAMVRGTGGLAIGEIVGASIFVVGVVVGSLALLISFPVEAASFKRDASFLLAAVLIIIVCVCDGYISWAEACLMVCVYVIYALVVVRQHYLEMRAVGLGASDEEEQPVLEQSPLWQSSTSLNSPFSDDGMTPIRSSLFSALEFPRHGPNSGYDRPLTTSPFTHPLSRPPLHSTNSVPHLQLHVYGASDQGGGPARPDESQQGEEEGNETGYRISHNRQHSQPQSRPQPSLPTDTTHLSPHDLPKLHTRTSSSAQHQEGYVSLQDHTHRIEPVLTPLLGPDPGPQVLSSPANSEYSSLYGDVNAIEHLFPAFVGWRERGFVAHIVAVALAIPILVFSASIPVPVRSSQKSIATVHAIGIPIVLAWLCGAGISWQTCVFILTSIAAGMGILHYVQPPKLFLIGVGFIMATMWIVDLASELVTVLEALGIALHVSDAVMGLTVFAIGDSLGDLVSNMSIAQTGYPIIAMSACFGGPMFTLLVGIGGASLVTMLVQGQGTIHVPISHSILVSCVILLMIILFLLLAIPAQGYRMTAPIGAITISLWALNLVASVYLGT